MLLKPYYRPIWEASFFQQFHGGIGVDMDYDLHFYYRRAKAFELKFGSPSYHLEALGAEI